MSGTGIGIGIGVVIAVVAVGILIYYCLCVKDRKFLFQNNTNEYDQISHSDRFYGRNKGLDTETRRENQNLAFYRNLIPSKPDGATIEHILGHWKGNYHLLEKNHNYIQWLFPNRKPGVNQLAAILTDKEAKIIRETPELRNRVKCAFEMMLDFYGMALSGETFTLSAHGQERLEELNKWGNHNFLRISRILLALKELGHRELMLPWMKFLCDQIYKTRHLDKAQSSFEQHWIETLDAEDKLYLQRYLRENFIIQMDN